MGSCTSDEARRALCYGSERGGDKSASNGGGCGTVLLSPNTIICSLIWFFVLTPLYVSEAG